MQNYQDLPLSTADRLFIVPTLADLPVNAVESELRWVSDISQVYAFNGAAWVVSSGGGLSPACDPGPFAACTLAIPLRVAILIASRAPPRLAVS